MPSGGFEPRAPPRAFSRSEVAQSRAAGSCWLLRGRRVYDVGAFLRRHPGGAEELLRRAGSDVGPQMDGPPHRHSENARRWMEQYYIGDLSPEPAEEEEEEEEGGEDSQVPRERRKSPEEPSAASRCSKVDPETDLVDWGKPLAWQVGHLGERYDAWVHQPVDRPIRLFHSPLAEASTKTAWYMVPIVWLPLVFYLSWSCCTTLSLGETRVFLTRDLSVPLPPSSFPPLFLLGAGAWSLLEYLIHRFLFHMRPPARSYGLTTLHFLLHGQHHKSPFDGSRLVFPPALAAPVVGAFYLLARRLLPEGVGLALFAGGLCGYVAYDMVHYYLHYGSPRAGSYLHGLKAHHVKHHFQHQRAGFGITTTFWDHPFGTTIPEETFEKSQ
ncbi:fatty acid 2-hydroxylase-like [Megalops cyprinoides]|uniref:fatty acid 2-hydroxylase-like n=1 Tax=Megalops cyprinoides TaxID=118141 RepID=UPI0018650D1E|nr:fatty acid 2-hydroxylase-like [Megalops cyprinoides]